MNIRALMYRDDGTEVPIPTTPGDWWKWVSAGRTRNWMLHDPLIDWLQLYGKDKNYVPTQGLPDYNPNLDFLEFIFEKGRGFESGILGLFEDLYEVATVAHDYKEILSLQKAEETFHAMREGVPIVHQGVLWDAQNLNYGAPDFLVRSDVLREMFPHELTTSESAFPAPGLQSTDWHYRVVDTKFTTLHFNANGSQLGNDGCAPAYKAQLYIYNRMLGRVQGFEPPVSFLLGRGWRQETKGTTYRGQGAFERLGRVPQQGTIARGIPISQEVERALQWVRRVRKEGGGWELIPEPSVPELYPNMSNPDDGDMALEMGSPEYEPGGGSEDANQDWYSVKKWLAGQLRELTQLWQVGVGGREAAHTVGIRRWDDPQLTPEKVGIKGGTRGPVLKEILEVNNGDGPPVRPTYIIKTRPEWHEVPTVEFYVDFEFCSDLNDDFVDLPERGGQSLIFMIGCGNLEDGKWQFRSFVADLLSEDEELRIIQDWVKHMESVRDRLDPANARPRIMHWSNAEVSALESSHNSARNRHGLLADWPHLGWYDFLQNVMRAEPVVVRGALGYGLKAVANAMRSHGLIETGWDDSSVDGLGAMVGTWHCDAKAKELGVPMTQVEPMDEIVRYNEVDCRVMMEIVRYFRLHH